MNVILRLALPILPQILKLVTPLLRESLEEAVKDLFAKAKKTDNPVDDILVAVLAGLIGVDVNA
jgi:hypothetical protein